MKNTSFTKNFPPWSDALPPLKVSIREVFYVTPWIIYIPQSGFTAQIFKGWPHISSPWPLRNDPTPQRKQPQVRATLCRVQQWTNVNRAQAAGEWGEEAAADEPFNKCPVCSGKCHMCSSGSLRCAPQHSFSLTSAAAPEVETQDLECSPWARFTASFIHHHAGLQRSDPVQVQRLCMFALFVLAAVQTEWIRLRPTRNTVARIKD